MKICRKSLCIHEGNLQPLSNFNKKKSNKDGYNGACKDCRQQERLDQKEVISLRSKKRRESNLEKVKNQQKLWYDKNREIVLAKQLQKKYGIPEDLAILAVNKKIPCMICRSYQKVCVDHCHDTGRVRGFLCEKCNFAYGLLQEDSKIIKRLAIYAEAQERLKELTFEGI